MALAASDPTIRASIGGRKIARVMLTRGIVNLVTV